MYYQQFYEMPIWKKGAKLLKEIYEVTKDFPVEEKYSLTSQIRRSANSIVANIAECHGRYFYKDKIRILYIARGEVEEIRSHLLIAKELSFINTKKLTELNNSYNLLSKEINSLIINLSCKYQRDK